MSSAHFNEREFDRVSVESLQVEQPSQLPVGRGELDIQSFRQDRLASLDIRYDFSAAIFRSPRRVGWRPRIPQGLRKLITAAQDCETKFDGSAPIRESTVAAHKTTLLRSFLQ